MDERLQKLFDEIYTPVSTFDVTAYITDEPVTYENRKEGRFMPLCEGERWGKLWDCAWMEMKDTVPEGTDLKNIAFLLDVGGEGLVGDSLKRRAL
jgi:alpha-mannosidase